MRPRRQAREIALQILYQLDAQEGMGAREAIRLFWTHLAAEAEGEVAAHDDSDGAPAPGAGIGSDVRSYAEELVIGVAESRGELDEAISAASRNWRLERMARVDRNLLRLGLHEMRKNSSDAPAKVALNEAIEIAKRFGTSESAAFVNGILDRCLSGGRSAK